MDSNKVQWLQRMGIDVWQHRKVSRTTSERNQDDSSLKTPSSSIPSDYESANTEENQPDATKNISSRSTESRAQVSKQIAQSNRQVQMTLSCSTATELLLIRDNEAIDRDFTEDVFRAYRLLKGIDVADSEVSFFRFNWPDGTQLPNVQGGDDASLASARRAFLAAARSVGKGLPMFVIAFGQKAVQLTNDGTFDNAQVFQCLDESDPSSFKKKIWTFLRDDQ